MTARISGLHGKGRVVGNSVSLVTGAAGFIGSHLAARLVAMGDEVHALVRPTTSLVRLAPLAGRLTIHATDFADRRVLQECVAAIAPTRVFHLAAETRMPATPSPAAARETLGHYIGPLLNLVEALSALPVPPTVMVRAGTIAEYGDAALPYRETGAARPTTPYGAGMLAATHYLAMLAPTLPFPAITARLALCYGPAQSPSFFVPSVIEAALSRRPVTMQRPDDRRDLLHVADVVDAILRIAERAPRDCPVVNVGSGLAPTMREVADRIVELTGCDPALVIARAAQPGDRPVELRFATELAQTRFEWTRQIALDDGLRQTIAAEQHLRSLAG